MISVIPAVPTPLLRGAVACSSSACDAATLRPAFSRRAALSCAFGSGLLFLCSDSAHAYGGGANLRATDAGTGNPRYEELAAAMAAGGRAPGRVLQVGPPPAPAKCRMGREPACFK